MAKLYRSKNKVIAGVCAGIAENLGWDPVWIRLIFIILTIATAIITGILVYAIMWIAMPEKN